eukprot:Opistho-2@32411
MRVWSDQYLLAVTMSDGMETKRRRLDIADAVTPDCRVVRMNSAYDNAKTKRMLSLALHEGTPFDDDGVTGAFATADPFPCCRLPNFVDDSEGFLRDVLAELRTTHMYRKSNDLYDFHQTDDMKRCDGNVAPLVCRLKDMLYTELLRWMRDVTGIDLNNTVNMTCARYGLTDNLLCHDDELEGRRIAYILYLVPPDWTAAKGGCLDLFSVDSSGQPDKIVQSLVPQWNQLAFFEVSPVSFHQVAECMCDDGRISISGWFYGPPIIRPPPHIEPPPHMRPPLALATSNSPSLAAWVSPQYLDTATKSKIRGLFVDESSAMLGEFLRPEKYAAVRADIMSLSRSSSPWVMRGPANRRHYEHLATLARIMDAPDSVAAVAAATEVERELHVPNLCGLALLLRSTAFQIFLSEITGLDLDTSTAEMRRFGKSCYTPLYDDESAHSMANSTSLDAVLYLIAPVESTIEAGSDWSTRYGGHTIYVSKGEDDELLSVTPRPNALSLVFKDEGTLSFVKYVNCIAPADVHDLCMHFAEASH